MTQLGDSAPTALGVTLKFALDAKPIVAAIGA